MVKCHSCSRRYNEELEFCPHCGALNIDFLSEAQEVRQITLSFGDELDEAEDTAEPSTVAEPKKRSVADVVADPVEDVVADALSDAENDAISDAENDAKIYARPETRKEAETPKPVKPRAKAETSKPVERRDEVETPKPVKPIQKEKPSPKTESPKAESLKDESAGDTKKFSPDDMREIDRALKSTEKSEQDIVLSDNADLDEETGPSELSIFMSGLGTSIAAWWQKQRGNFSDWSATQKEKFEAWKIRQAEAAEARRIAQEEEAARRAEAERIAQEEEAIRQAEAQRIAQEEAEQRAEELRIAQEQEAARQVEAQRIAQAEEARQAEELRIARQEAARLAEEERIIKQREDKRRAEEARRRQARLDREAEEERRRQEELDILFADEEMLREQELSRREQELRSHHDDYYRDPVIEEVDEDEYFSRRGYREEYRDYREARRDADHPGDERREAGRPRHERRDVGRPRESGYRSEPETREAQREFESRETYRRQHTDLGPSPYVINDAYNLSNEFPNYEYETESERRLAEAQNRTRRKSIDEFIKPQPKREDRIAEEIVETTESVEAEGGFNLIEWVLVRFRPIHGVIAAAVVIVIVVALIVANSGSPTKDFARALSERNYQEAGELYSSYLGNEKLEESSETDLSDYLEQLTQNLADGSTSYAATYSALDVIINSELYQGDAKVMLDNTLEEVLRLQDVSLIYERAVDKQNDLDYEGALRELNQLTSAYPDYRDADERLVEVRENYREQVIREVGSLQSQGNFTEADRLLDSALTLIPDDPVLSNLKENNLTQSETALYEQASVDAQRFFAAGNYAEMFRVVDEAIAAEPENTALADLRAEYELMAAETILNTADNIFLQGDEEAALAYIEEGLEIIPDHHLLLEAKDRYELQLGEEGSDDNNSESPDNTTENDDTDAVADESVEGPSGQMSRGNYADLAGDEHDSSVLVTHEFTGSADVVESYTFYSGEDAGRFIGEIAIGQVDEYTQVYYQVYSSQNLASPVQTGSLYGNPSEVGENYKISIDYASGNAGYFIVNLNYLRGGSIEVILDLGFEG